MTGAQRANLRCSLRRSLRCSLGCSLVWLLAGCPSANNGNPYMPPPTGGGTSGHMPSGTVIVEIQAPPADMSYPRGSLVEVTARVTIENGTDFVDTTKVRMTLQKVGLAAVVETGQLVLASSSADTFEGRLSLGDLESGDYTLTVLATSSGGATGSAPVNIKIDAGPLVIVNSPIEGKSYKRTLTIEVVASDPFGLEQGYPTATIGSIDVQLTATGVMDTFRGAIDFDAQDPPLFGPQLLTVVAVNSNGRRTEKQVVFVIDNEGPQITMTTPEPGEMVGGIVRVSAFITDNAGVLDSSVIAVIGDDTSSPKFELPLKALGVGVYSILFDSNRLTECKEPPATSACIVFPTISFRASDEVGNETVVTYDFFVDNIAPLADLDPPNVRDTKIDGVLRCSWSFDPLGLDTFSGDMPNDNSYVPQVFDLRARVEDRGNRAAGLKISPIARVDPARTDVYVLDDVNQPLIVDTDGNGSCDSINPLLIPTTMPPTANNQVLKVRLAPVPPAGVANFTPDASAAGLCLSGRDPEIPHPLCPGHQPTEAISYYFGLPAIWSVEPINALRCQGNQFDTKANNIEPGWACIAVGSTDLAGNFGVSAPLRVYIDQTDPGKYTHAFGDKPTGVGAVPSCTGTWDRATNTVSSTPCTTLKFPYPNDPATYQEFCYLGDCD